MFPDCTVLSLGMLTCELKEKKKQRQKPSSSFRESPQTNIESSGEFGIPSIFSCSTSNRSNAIILDSWIQFSMLFPLAENVHLILVTFQSQ
jgi:hypothetical protein